MKYEMLENCRISLLNTHQCPFNCDYLTESIYILDYSGVNDITISCSSQRVQVRPLTATYRLLCFHTDTILSVTQQRNAVNINASVSATPHDNGLNRHTLI